MAAGDFRPTHNPIRKWPSASNLLAGLRYTWTMKQSEDDLLGFSLDAPQGLGEFDKSEEAVVPYVRGDRFSVERMTDEKKMITWINSVRKAPIDGIDDMIVHESYAAAVWLFRAAAVRGDLKATSALEKWLIWAKPIVNRPRPDAAPKPSTGSVAFLPREPEKETK